MRAPPTCPRCAGPLSAPDLWSSAWRCAGHGEVPPYSTPPVSTPEALRQVVDRARAAVWLPRPLPSGFGVAGVGWAGDERTGAVATVVALSGPSPLGGPCDLLIVAEEPGVGLGARFAGLPSAYPPDGFDAGPPYAKVEVASHPVATWVLPTQAERAACAGEAQGRWLWLVVRPGSADLVLMELDVLDDLRQRPVLPDVPYAARTPLLD